MESAEMPLAGRSAIITGGNQGLGRAIAEHFVRAGAGVLLTARSEQLLEQTSSELTPLAALPGQKVLYHVADVSKSNDCRATVSRAVTE
ncbi:MAG TPA: SDR family NAD(P)-dependent oxidoreductase, partial [Gemmata sp.]|nr:SDR family NAD(P)-dependent oxidoreductase [Gemmata sp.]